MSHMDSRLCSLSRFIKFCFGGNDAIEDCANSTQFSKIVLSQEPVEMIFVT
jgi:hypothetical protein